MGGKALLIDRANDAFEGVSALLSRNGFEVVGAHSGIEGLRLAYQHQPDVVVLEAGVTNPDGWEVCRRLREMSDVPIIFHTECCAPADVVRGLDIGADDYVLKPGDDNVLLARIRARMRRSPHESANSELVYSDGDLCINFFSREVTARGNNQHLTPKEFSLLAVLARNAGRVVTRDELVTQAWGKQYGDAIDSLKLYIHYLRKKIETDPQKPKYILTSRGVGYRFNGH